jgi:hypothetical protein
MNQEVTNALKRTLLLEEIVGGLMRAINGIELK